MYNSTNYTIKDLNWREHPSGLGGEQALVEFPNGFGASILRGGLFYTANGTYEVAVLLDRCITYDTGITDDVLGFLTEDEVRDVLCRISKLKKEKTL